MRTISRKNFLIRSCTVKMFSMSSKPKKKKKRRRPKHRLRKPPNRKKYRRKWQNYRFQIQITSPRQAKILKFLTRCTWIISKNWIRVKILQTTAPWCRSGHILSRAQSQRRASKQPTRTETIMKRTQVESNIQKVDLDRVKTIWLIFQPVNFPSFRNICRETTASNNLTKDLT